MSYTGGRSIGDRIGYMNLPQSQVYEITGTLFASSHGELIAVVDFGSVTMHLTSAEACRQLEAVAGQLAEQLERDPIDAALVALGYPEAVAAAAST